MVEKMTDAQRQGLRDFQASAKGILTPADYFAAGIAFASAEPSDAALAEGRRALYAASGGDIEATDYEVRQTYKAMTLAHGVLASDGSKPE